MCANKLNKNSAQNKHLLDTILKNDDIHDEHKVIVIRNLILVFLIDAASMMPQISKIIQRPLFVQQKVFD